MTTYLWVDLETTGLEPSFGSILEVAAVVTNENLDEIGEPLVSLVAPRLGFGYEVMDKYVFAMHTVNGLIADLYVAETMHVREGIPDFSEVQHMLLSYVEKLGNLRQISLAGSSIHFDRAWLHEHMRDFESKLSHRMLDVSSFTLLAKDWNPEVYASRPGLGPDGKPMSAHRALADIRNSLATLRHYRERGFVGGA